MDIFEKQQTIEAIKTIVKARWFYIPAIILTGFIIKLLFTGVPVPSIARISLLALAALSYNFAYWLYVRRSPEKISSSGLKIVKVLQVVGDQFAISAIFYFSGSANKIMVVFYFVTIMIASSLYGKKGIILTTIFTILMYSGTVLLEYFGLMPAVSTEEAIQASGKLLRGNIDVTKVVIVSFSFYITAGAFVAGYIANLFRRREKHLIAQKNELTQKTELLTTQTRELTKTKDYLHEALTKSDAARIEIEKTKTELEKANLELKAKLNELEKYGRVTTGRELKMIELKKEIKKLQDTVGDLQEQLNKRH